MMQFATVRELSQKPSKYLTLGQSVIITKHGKPLCALVSLEGDEWEDFVLAEHFDLKNEAQYVKSLSRKGKTLSAARLKKKFS